VPHAQTLQHALIAQDFLWRRRVLELFATVPQANLLLQMALVNGVNKTVMNALPEPHATFVKRISRFKLPPQEANVWIVQKIALPAVDHWHVQFVQRAFSFTATAAPKIALQDCILIIQRLNVKPAPLVDLANAQLEDSTILGQISAHEMIWNELWAL